MTSLEVNSTILTPLLPSQSVNATFVYVDPYQEAYENFYVRLYFAIACFIIEVPGNYLLLVLVISINEDPLVMVTDRLLGLVCCLTMLINCMLSCVGKLLYCSYNCLPAYSFMALV